MSAVQVDAVHLVVIVASVKVVIGDVMLAKVRRAALQESLLPHSVAALAGAVEFPLPNLLRMAVLALQMVKAFGDWPFTWLFG